MASLQKQAYSASLQRESVVVAQRANRNIAQSRVGRVACKIESGVVKVMMLHVPDPASLKSCPGANGDSVIEKTTCILATAEQADARSILYQTNHGM